MSDDTARELERLRAEVAALTAAQKASTGPPAEQPSSPPGEAAAAVATQPEAAAEESTSPFETQLKELAELLESEIRDLPAVTCLAVFALGILMGRFLR